MKNNIHICHITNWYPSADNKSEAIWIKNHFESLQPYCDNSLLHIQVKTGKFAYKESKISANESSYILYVKTKRWLVIEILTTLLLLYVLIFKLERRKISLYNFHITYPLLTYSRIIQLFIRKKMVVTEHWSAYNLNFGVKKRLRRIERIFHNKSLSFICVSEDLRKSIERFSRTQIDAKIIRNVVNTSDFSNRSIKREKNLFYMVSYWKYPKIPILALKAFKVLADEGHKFRLSIGGYGPLMVEIESFIVREKLEGYVEFRGRQSHQEVAESLNACSYYVHASEYESASVICTEALSCGTPVISSAVGGILEYTHTHNSILVENTIENWVNALSKAILEQNWDYESISNEAQLQFDKQFVGKSYFNYLKSFLTE